MPTKLFKHVSTEFGWLIFFPIWVLIPIFVGVIGYKASNPAHEKELIDPIKKNWSKTELVSADGTKYVRFQYKDGVMEIPTEFISFSTAERSTFDLIAYLPDMVSKKKRPKTELQNHSLLVRILLRLNEDTSSLTASSTQESMLRLWERGSLSEPFKDKDFPRFEIYNGPAGFQYWVPEANTVLSPSGKNVAFLCRVNPRLEKKFGHCETTLPWSNNLTIRYSLYLPQMHAIETIHTDIIGFVKSLDRNN